tara:strand:+ start:63 stop:257 length:195 start_codon:yes stop_codon:yes gene_type:complete
VSTNGDAHRKDNHTHLPVAVFKKTNKQTATEDKFLLLVICFLATAAGVPHANGETTQLFNNVFA